MLDDAADDGETGGGTEPPRLSPAPTPTPAPLRGARHESGPSAGPPSSRPQTAPRLLVTAGPTEEPIDEVRFLANRSSGRLGLAIAAAAERRNWPVTCLLGPVPTPQSPPAVLQRFRTAAELESQLEAAWPSHDLLVMAAAVADFRPRRMQTGKLRRGGPLTLELEAVPDLLAGLRGTTSPRQRIIAFALEEEASLEARAREKLARKGADAIVANPIETLDSASIRGRLLRRDGTERHPPGHPAAIPKEAFAEWLLDEAVALFG